MQRARRFEKGWCSGAGERSGEKATNCSSTVWAAHLSCTVARSSKRPREVPAAAGKGVPSKTWKRRDPFFKASATASGKELLAVTTAVILSSNYFSSHHPGKHRPLDARVGRSRIVILTPGKGETKRGEISQVKHRENILQIHATIRHKD